ncbi:MAG TPA: serine hydrolase domain-containing protein [Planctomycetota bacterium]|nr:serine hydrolase domain-containing protein [Planctomycetota bacterium]
MPARICWCSALICLLCSAFSARLFAQETIRGVQVSGVSTPALQPLDNLMVDFVTQYKVPGASLAVTKDNRLVYARGFGCADEATGECVQPQSLFRIASISKPVTAAAIFKLVELGKLSLDAKVFSLLPLTRNKEFADPRLHDITVLHLLQHRGGWDREKSGDPMFKARHIAASLKIESPPGPADIITYMTGMKLDFAPGERYAYSNFGYCLLGRVIEEVSKQPYDVFVREKILAPIGIRRMQLGRTLLDNRVPGEVKYVAAGSGDCVFGSPAKKVPLPYGVFCVEAMDAHGGWVATAAELTRFANALEPTYSTPLLNAASLSAMFARPPGAAGHTEAGEPKKVFYACGWSVRKVKGETLENHWHNGALAGTSTLLVRRHDGLSWAVLFNTRSSPKDGDLSALIDPRMHQAVDQVKDWPTGDLAREVLK